MKKGFTLVELLAVIVILGIIAVITTPVIRGVIDNSRRESFLDSVGGLIHAVELDIADRGFGIYEVYQIDGNSATPIDPFIQVQGSVSGLGRVIANQDGDIDVLIEFDQWCAYKPIETNIVRLYDAPCIQNADMTGANRPYLHDDMIPVRYSGTNIFKADDRNPGGTPWYNYENSIWANAVVVEEAHRDNYLDADAGTSINRDHVMLELVWVPRFRYKADVNPIDIEFVKGAPYVSSPVTTQGYRVHPAFTFGDKNLRGFWVSKYQLSGTLSSIESKYNETPLTDQALNNIYSSVANMNSLNNPYGFSTGILNARLQKNTEWAAIAYLAQSDYGIGVSNIVAGGSTTGNTSGVYDMVGPVSDFVMTSFNDRPGGSLMFHFPEEKFYNKYSSENINQACKGRTCYGHGLTETNTFHGGPKNFVTGANPFLIRGVSSLLDYENTDGAGSASEGFKLTISRR